LEYGTGGPDTARLLVSCPDRPGIVAAVSQFLYESGANIVTSDQYSGDPEGGSFFLRMSFRLPGVTDTRAALETAFSNVAQQFAMEWRFFVWRRLASRRSDGLEI
jgi:formyltetrahydrofolate deformylase